MSKPRIRKSSAAARTLDIFAAPKQSPLAKALDDAGFRPLRKEVHEVLPNPPPVQHHTPAPWTCQRCDQEKPLNRRRTLVAFDENGQSEPTGFLRICTFCLATLSACLEKGTRLTPIYMPAARPRAKLKSPKRRPMPYTE